MFWKEREETKDLPWLGGRSFVTKGLHHLGATEVLHGWYLPSPQKAGCVSKCLWRYLLMNTGAFLLPYNIALFNSATPADVALLR